jgi:tetratricopeptide (TPR) repeat protein
MRYIFTHKWTSLAISAALAALITFLMYKGIPELSAAALAAIAVVLCFIFNGLVNTAATGAVMQPVNNSLSKLRSDCDPQPLYDACTKTESCFSKSTDSFLLNIQLVKSLAQLELGEFDEAKKTVDGMDTSALPKDLTSKGAMKKAYSVLIPQTVMYINYYGDTESVDRAKDSYSSYCNMINDLKKADPAYAQKVSDSYSGFESYFAMEEKRFADALKLTKEDELKNTEPDNYTIASLAYFYGKIFLCMGKNELALKHFELAAKKAPAMYKGKESKKLAENIKDGNIPEKYLNARANASDSQLLSDIDGLDAKYFIL